MYPDFFTTDSWKKTALGSSIALSASAPLEKLRGEKPIILVGGVHGDEPEGVRLANDTLTWLKSDAARSKALAPWVVIPCLNVDGFAKQTRVNGRGVDLNRNYPSRDWSPTADKERYFPGPYAASEPEIQGMVELIQTLKPRLLIHCHSWEPCIIATGEAAFQDGEKLAKSCGYELRGEIGYPTPGSLSRYGWHDNRIPVICIEERHYLEDLATIWPRFQSGITGIFRDTSLRGAVHE